MVRADAPYASYQDVIIDMLARSDKWDNADSAWRLILERGCQARRGSSGMDVMMKAARAKRVQLEQKPEQFQTKPLSPELEQLDIWESGRRKSSKNTSAKPLKIPWNVYESALLLDTYLRMKQKELNRRQAVSELSQKLRTIALNHGISIDDTYRNENGMSFYISRVENEMTGGKKGLAPVRNVKEIVKIYREDRARYEDILKEAKAMIEQKT